MNRKISVDDAYRAMFRFLEGYIDRTKADEIAALLGSMALADDGVPMDPAMWNDWLAAVRTLSEITPENGGDSQ